MSNLPQTSQQDIITKRTQWANLGELIYKKDFELQARAQSLIAQIPKDFTDIVAGESKLADIGAGLKALIEDRMKITNPVNNKMSELMLSEKSVKEAMDLAKVSLLDSKQNAANLAAAATAKSDELQRAREAIANYLVKSDASFRCNITETVATLFAEALEMGVEEANISDWIQEKKSVTFKIADFSIKQPVMKPNLNTPESIQAIWDELTMNVTQEAEYLLMFYKELDDKFAFYGISLKNKTAAIEMTVYNVAQERAKLAAEVSASETSNKLAALAVQVDVISEPTGRALKLVYEIDVPDTEQGAIAIMAAYIGNLSACRPGTRVTSYRKLTVQQMAAALESAKKKDVNFQPQRINFKSKNKL